MKSASFPAFSLMRIGRIASLTAMPLLFAACTAMGPVASHYPDADLAVARQAMAQAQSSDLAYDLVASLTTEVGPRSAGSPGDAAAVAWAKANPPSAAPWRGRSARWAPITIACRIPA